MPAEIICKLLDLYTKLCCKIRFNCEKVTFKKQKKKSIRKAKEIINDGHLPT